MRVVDSEDANTATHPNSDDTFDLRIQTLGIVLEVQRLDVLILLRWVLGIGDRAIVSDAEPLGMLVHPRVIG